MVTLCPGRSWAAAWRPPRGGLVYAVFLRSSSGITSERSTPMGRLSLAISKSSMSTRRLFLRAAGRASLLDWRGPRRRKRAARDVGLDVGRERHLAHVHEEDLLAAADVGQRHYLASKRPGRIGPGRARRAVGGDRHTGYLLKPSISQRLIQRLLALVVAAAQAYAALAADRVDLVGERCRVRAFACSNMSHARSATPTNISTKSGRRWKNGTLASPAMARAAASCRCRGRRPSARRAGAPPSFWNLDGSRSPRAPGLLLSLLRSPRRRRRSPWWWIHPACARALAEAERAAAATLHRRMKNIQTPISRHQEQEMKMLINRTALLRAWP